MTRARKIGEAAINGRQVSFFSPPHSEADLPWVDVVELARAFLPKAAALRMVSHAQRFGGSKTTVAVAKNGSRVATIMCHSMAQGLTGAIDAWNGHPENGVGPAFNAYVNGAADFAKNHWPLSFEDMILAVKNSGGPYMRGF